MLNLFRDSVRLAASIALVAGISAWTTTTAKAADQMKGGEHMLHLQGISTKAEADGLKPGDQVAMVCAKCKTVLVNTVNTQKGHIRTMTVGEKHLCPGCSSTITVVGVGKGKHDEVKHVCEKCGDESAFCCATKSGAPPTKGMEKEKK